MSHTEYLDVLDENGHKTGTTKTKPAVHRDGDWHRTVHVWIVNSTGDILVQRRAKNIDSYPDMLDVSAAGHISAGESSLESAVREVGEELGIKVKPADLQFVKTVTFSHQLSPTYINNEFVDLYIFRSCPNPSNMKIQESEVQEVFYLPYKKFKSITTSPDSEFVPNHADFHTLFALLDPQFDPA